jgi:hypothetical protein
MRVPSTFSTSSTVAPMVPPVARRSSTISTREPAGTASWWMHRVSSPYSSS